MKVIRKLHKYYSLFTKVRIELKLSKPYKIILIELIPFDILNCKTYFDLFVIVVKNNFYAHYDLNCYY